MLDKERIKLMTKMAAYEQQDGKKYLPVAKYYRKDYIGIQMIKSFFYSTMAFCILLLLRILYELDSWVEDLYSTDLAEVGMSVLIQYVIFVVVYEVVTVIVYSLRHTKSRKSVKQYQVKLKKVEKLYEREEKLHNGEEWDY